MPEREYSGASKTYVLYMGHAGGYQNQFVWEPQITRGKFNEKITVFLSDLIITIELNKKNNI